MLVDERRLEFVIGAWCMNDEASTYYQDIIDQQTLGLQFILKEFGECARPRTAWQIDPFGHSREQASLFAQFGFDGLFQGRIDYQDNDYRRLTKTREMVWQASSSLGEKAKIFTGILPNGYSPPDGFCFDSSCGDDPIMDNPKLEDFNLNEKVDAFIQAVIDESKGYSTKNLIMTMGSDFHYSNALMWFKNLDKLIIYVNQRQSNGSKINIFYSTPACYLNSLFKANLTWPVKTDDFFPYAHRPHSFWTGYFTSRTTLKYFVRRANNFYQGARQIFALITGLIPGVGNGSESLGVLGRSLGVAQHHDGVSGTEKQHVAYDYAKRLSIGIADTTEAIHKALPGGKGIDFNYCSTLNISECLPVEKLDRFVLYLYNPLCKTVDPWFRVPVSDCNYEVRCVDSMAQVKYECVPIDASIENIPERKATTKYELLFKVQLLPLAIQEMLVARPMNAYEASASIQSLDSHKKTEVFVVKNQHLSLSFDANGNMLQMTNLNQKLSTNMVNNYCYYRSMPGDNSIPDRQASGAYIFRPNGSECLSVASYTIQNGQQYQEVRQVYNDWISQTIRLYDDAQYVEFEWQVGPINVDDKVGKEVIVKFSSDLQSSATFYTDANGREILKRVRNFRATWPFNNTEPVSGNYYPVNSRIFIRDELPSVLNRQLTIVTDRTHGASSITDGSIEVMLHRRTLYDDRLGVNEPLNEPGLDYKGLVARGKFYLFFNSTQNSVQLHRNWAHQINTQPIVFFLNAPSQMRNMRNILAPRGFYDYLPENVHLLTFAYDFDYKQQDSLIVRLEHFYELSEDPILSLPAHVDLGDFFNKTINGDGRLFLNGAVPLSLGANFEIDKYADGLKFNALKEPTHERLNEPSSLSSFDVVLNPMEIKTYRLLFTQLR